MTRKFEIAIAGGGLNGMSLSLALQSAGFSVALIDSARLAQDTISFDGRAYALALTVRRFFDALGVWPALAEQAEPMREIKVSDGRPGEGAAPFFMHFDHAEIEEGPMGYMVEDRHLRAALLAEIAGRNITLIPQTKVTDHSAGPAGVDITLSSGERLSATLLIGADGKQSPTARRAGIRRTEWSYGQTALVAAVGHEHPHHGVAHQFFMPSGPLAILPLRGNRSSIVWSETSDAAQKIAALEDAAFLRELRPRFGSFLGDITLEGDRAAFPLGLSLAQSFVGDRLALVGDAAHGLHPIAGQGLNAGLRDIAAIAEVLTDARRRGEDIGAVDVLDRYQRWRRFDVATLAAATDGFNRLFSNDNPGLRTLRDLGLGLVQSLPGLKRGFIREAAGLTGDVPKLMRGLPL